MLKSSKTLSLVFLSFALISLNAIPIDQESSETLLAQRLDLFQGDIAGVKRSKGVSGNLTVIEFERELWPNGVIPYVIDPIFTSEQVLEIRLGMRLLEDETRVNGRYCVRFVPRSNEEIYVRIVDDDGCWSYIGKPQHGPYEQELSLSRGCTKIGIVVHELLHALGFLHEQSRPDRDTYIQVNYANIRPGAEEEFEKYPADQVDLLGTEYDYDSVMHYGMYDFSVNNKPVIIPTDPAANNIIGQRTHVSKTDALEVQRLYKCI